MTIVSPARNWRAFLAALAALAGCSALAPRQLPAPATTKPAAEEPIVTPAPPAVPLPQADPNGLEESQARALLAARFRGAGLRVRYDVALEGPGFSFTADGYDPDRAVGYEYVAFAEADTDITADEATALAASPEPRVLVVWATNSAAVDAAARAFLADLPD